VPLKSDEIKTTWNFFEEDGREGERDREREERKKEREGGRSESGSISTILLLKSQTHSA